MKEIKYYDCGAYGADVDSISDTVKTISDAKVVKTTEAFEAWDGSTFETVPAGSMFVVVDDAAYPFSAPFYEADEDEGTSAQAMPETWEDVIFLQESFRC